MFLMGLVWESGMMIFMVHRISRAIAVSDINLAISYGCYHFI